jgi:hypothetical protein
MEGGQTLDDVERGKGPVWYCALLLIVNAVSTVKPAIKVAHWSWRTVNLALIELTACFVVRLYYPAGVVFPLFNRQLGFTPHYILAYSVGHVLVFKPSYSSFTISLRPFLA